MLSSSPAGPGIKTISAFLGHRRIHNRKSYSEFWPVILTFHISIPYFLRSMALFEGLLSPIILLKYASTGRSKSDPLPPGLK
jgi:hypothetical protein